VGDELTLLVIRVDPNERRIGLSLKELAAAVMMDEPAQSEGAGGRGRGKGKRRRQDDDFDDED
jgi:ribosomal protein S1